MKKLILLVSTIAPASFALAQMGPGPEGTPPPHPDFTPEWEVPEEIIDLRNDLRASREALRETRQAALSVLPEDATYEDKQAVLEQWAVDNADKIADSEALAELLRETIKEVRPEREPPVEIPEEIITAREELQALRQSLGAERETLIESLRAEGATRDEIEAALEDWRAENAEDIEAAKALATTVRDWFRENRPQRPDRGHSGEMQDRRQNFRENAMAMAQARQQLRQELKGLTGQERRARIREFNEAQKDLMDERKQLKREARQSGSGSVGGDRRPGG